jgi:hypothetical protein
MTTTARLLDLPVNQLRRAGKYGYWHAATPGGCQPYGGCHQVNAIVEALLTDHPELEDQIDD